MMYKAVFLLLFSVNVYGSDKSAAEKQRILPASSAPHSASSYGAMDGADEGLMYMPNPPSPPLAARQLQVEAQQPPPPPLEATMPQVSAPKPDTPSLDREDMYRIQVEKYDPDKRKKEQEEKNNKNNCNPCSWRCDEECAENAKIGVFLVCCCPVIAVCSFCQLLWPPESRISNGRAFK